MRKFWTEQSGATTGFAPFPCIALSALTPDHLGLLRTQHGDIVIFDGHYKEMGRISLPANLGQASVRAGAPNFLAHNGQFSISFPTKSQVVSIDIQGKIIGKVEFPFQINSVAKLAEGWVATGMFKGTFLHVLSDEGKIITSLMPVEDYKIDHAMLPALAGRGIAISGTYYGVLVDAGIGAIEIRSAETHKIVGAFVSKDRTLNPLMQMVAIDRSGAPTLFLSWPGLPVGAVSVTSGAAGQFMVLSGSGKHLAQINGSTFVVNYFELPRLETRFQEIIGSCSFGESLLVQTVAGELWALDKNEVKETSQNDYLKAVNRKYATVHGISLGASIGHVFRDEDIISNSEFWKSISGNFEFEATVSSDGVIKSMRPVANVVQMYGEPECKRISEKILSMQIVTTGGSLGKKQTEMKVILALAPALNLAGAKLI